LPVPAHSLLPRVHEILRLPRGEQPAAALALRDALPPGQEAWNSDFGPGSLFTAFSDSTLARGLYEANRPYLRFTGPFRVIEVGGGNGRLWRGALPASARGEIVVVDPHPRGADGVRVEVPRGVTVTHVREPVESARLPDADVAVLSLVLHHVPGRDRAQNRQHGLARAGKLDALARVRAPLVLVNEADIHCDVDLAPGDTVLLERLCDSYVRRFGVAIAADHDAATRDDSRARLATILRDWALGQLDKAAVPLAARDVYELDVPRWLDLFAAAGLRVVDRRFTDPYMLFCQYVLSPAG